MGNFPFVAGQADLQDPTVARTPWDIVVLGQYTLPGISEVTVSRPRKLQVKVSKNQSYGTVKDTGLELARVTIKNVIAYPSQLDNLENIVKFYDTQLGLKVVGSPPIGTGQTVEGFAVNHPLLQIRGINSVYIEDIEGPHASRPGFITTIFKCIEIRGDLPTTTKKVTPGVSFAQGSTFTPAPAPTPPSQIKSAVAPKRIR